MSTLLARPPNHPETLSVDRRATCEATDCQISLLKLWIVNSFGQNATSLTGHSMVEQLLGLIGLPSRPSTRNQLCGCLTTKTHMSPCLLGPIDWKDAGGCSDLLNSLTLDQLGLSTPILSKHEMHFLCICKLKRNIDTPCWLSAPTGFAPSRFRQQLAKIAIGHAWLKDNLFFVTHNPCHPTASICSLLHIILLHSVSLRFLA